MSHPDDTRQWRSWFPVPVDGDGIRLWRWMLLEGDRFAVTAALLALVFVTFLAVGTLWTAELRRMLTETDAVQTLLNSLLSGIILLVSIVVSISSIVLSYDITNVGAQEERIQAAMEFRRHLGRLTETGQSPTDPASFLSLMGEVIEERARRLEDVTEGSDEEFARSVREYVQSVTNTVDTLGRTPDVDGGAEFGVLWRGMEMDYGTYMDRSRYLSLTYGEQLSEEGEERFQDLVRAFELFATGQEYFKTLFYGREISQLSRTLLVISLPAILFTAAATLTIEAGLLPNFWLFGLPPLLTLVAITLSVALAPFSVLTAYMLRVATVAKRTATAGPFSLQS